MQEIKSRLESLLRGVDAPSDLTTTHSIGNIGTLYSIWSDASKLSGINGVTLEGLGMFDALGNDYARVLEVANHLWTAWNYQASVEG